MIDVCAEHGVMESDVRKRKEKIETQSQKGGGERAWRGQ